MAEQSLEDRVAALERTVADLQRQQPAPRKWWEPRLPPMTPEELVAFDEMVEYGKYFRRTGRDAPPDWKPGDPIPDPDPDDEAVA